MLSMKAQPLFIILFETKGLSIAYSCLGKSLNLGRHCDSEKSSFGQAEVEATATEVTSLLCHVIVLDARQPLRD